MTQIYQLIPQTPGTEMQFVKRIADGAIIPFAPGNRDYQQYMDWLAKGNTPDPAPTPRDREAES